MSAGGRTRSGMPALKTSKQPVGSDGSKGDRPAAAALLVLPARQLRL